MSTIEPTGSAACRTRPRRIRFGLRCLLLIVLLASLGFAWCAYQQRRIDRRRQVLYAITEHGGTVLVESRHPVWQRYVWGPAADDVVLQVDLFGAHAPPELLASFDQLPDITYLDLSHVPLADEDLVHLRRLERLRVLYLAHTSITDEGLDHLRPLTNLYELDLTGTAVTTAAVDRLRAQMPHADITR